MGFSTLALLAQRPVAAGGTVRALWLAGFVAYPLGGIAAWLLWREVGLGVEAKRAALRCWGWQLLVGGLWPATLLVPVPFAELTLAFWLALSALTLRRFLFQHAASGFLFAPYCAWVLCVAVVAAVRFWPAQF